MAKLDGDLLMLNQLEFDFIKDKWEGLVGKPSRDAARAILPLLFDMSEEDAGKHKVCAIVKV